jgi:formyltetrahydrofolate hydrolase
VAAVTGFLASQGSLITEMSHFVDDEAQKSFIRVGFEDDAASEVAMADMTRSYKDLDEGPIIEQGVERVDHTMKPKELERIEQNSESTVLNRAIRWHAEHRVFESGVRTVVLRH